jgi:hypothetical protein
MVTYDTLSAALTGLKARGYTLDFNIAFDSIQCQAHNICLNPAEFEITAVYRFEGDSNPSDEEVVYAIASKNNSIKGTITSAFGLYADAVSTEMLQKLSVHINHPL